MHTVMVGRGRGAGFLMRFLQQHRRVAPSFAGYIPDAAGDARARVSYSPSFITGVTVLRSLVNAHVMMPWHKPRIVTPAPAEIAVGAAADLMPLTHHTP